MIIAILNVTFVNYEEMIEFYNRDYIKIVTRSWKRSNKKIVYSAPYDNNY